MGEPLAVEEVFGPFWGGLRKEITDFSKPIFEERGQELAENLLGNTRHPILAKGFED
jgi:hypothetical protein